MPGTYALTYPAPFPLSGADGPPEPGPSFDVLLDDAHGFNCAVTGVTTKVMIHSTLPTGFGGTSPRLTLIKIGDTAGTAILSLVEATPIAGNNIATSCSGLTFSDAASASFATAVSPYNGTFKPVGPAGMAVFGTVEVNGIWSLEMSNLNGPVIIDCWQLTYKTVAKP